MSLEVIKDRCPQNHKCPAVMVCPVEALSQETIEAPTVDQDLCIECGRCVEFCPQRALAL